LIFLGTEHVLEFEFLDLLESERILIVYILFTRIARLEEFVHHPDIIHRGGYFIEMLRPELDVLDFLHHLFSRFRIVPKVGLQADGCFRCYIGFLGIDVKDASSGTLLYPLNLVFVLWSCSKVKKLFRYSDTALAMIRIILFFPTIKFANNRATLTVSMEGYSNYKHPASSKFSM